MLRRGSVICVCKIIAMCAVSSIVSFRSKCWRPWRGLLAHLIREIGETVCVEAACSAASYHDRSGALRGLPAKARLHPKIYLSRRDAVEQRRSSSGKLRKRGSDLSPKNFLARVMRALLKNGSSDFRNADEQSSGTVSMSVSKGPGSIDLAYCQMVRYPSYKRWPLQNYSHGALDSRASVECSAPSFVHRSAGATDVRLCGGD